MEKPKKAKTLFETPLWDKREENPMGFPICYG